MSLKPALKKNKGLVIYCAVLLALALLLVIFEIRADEPLAYYGNTVSLTPVGGSASESSAVVTNNSKSHGIIGVQIKFEDSGEEAVTVEVTDKNGASVASFSPSGKERDGMYHYYEFSEGVTVASQGEELTVTTTSENTTLGKISARPVFSVLNYNMISVLLSAVAIFGCGLIFLIFLKNGFELKEEKVFLLLFTVAGLIYFVALPLYIGPDEESHFLRAFEISMGRFVSGDGSLPAGLSSGQASGNITLRYILDSISQGYNSSAEESYSYLNTALYSPINYLPQAMGIFIARLFTNNIWVLGYAAKAANFVTTGIILYFAIKYIPIGKNILLTVSLLPMSFQNCVVITADGLAFASAAAMVAYVLYLRYESKQPLTKKQRVLLYIIPFVLSMCKIVYLPLCLLLFLIPKERFKSKTDYIRSVATVGGMIVFLNLAWLLIAAGVLKTPYVAGADSPAQLKYLLSNPPSFLWACVKTILMNGRSYLDWMLGSMLGWLNVGIPWLATYTFALCLIYAALFDKSVKKDKRSTVSFVMSACSLLVILLTFMSLHIQFTEYKSGLVSGFQGRYLLPVLTPILLSLTVFHPNEKPERSMKALYITLGFMNIASALCALVQTI